MTGARTHARQVLLAAGIKIVTPPPPPPRYCCPYPCPYCTLTPSLPGAEPRRAPVPRGAARMRGGRARHAPQARGARLGDRESPGRARPRHAALARGREGAQGVPSPSSLGPSYPPRRAGAHGGARRRRHGLRHARLCALGGAAPTRPPGARGARRRPWPCSGAAPLERWPPPPPPPVLTGHVSSFPPY